MHQQSKFGVEELRFRRLLHAEFSPSVQQVACPPLQNIKISRTVVHQQPQQRTHAVGNNTVMTQSAFTV